MAFENTLNNKTSAPAGTNASDTSFKIDKEALMKQVMPIITSMAVGALVGSVLENLKKITATNVHKSSFMGDEERHPTKKEMNLSESNVSGSQKDASLSSDEVNAQSGSIDAAETEAKAATTEATAAEGGVAAARAKAGACDVETKALKVM